MLLLASGRSYRDICQEIGCSPAYVARWKGRFQKDRLAGLDSRYAGRSAWVITADMEARVEADHILAAVEKERLTRWCPIPASAEDAGQ